jgi:hypothetical protein
MKSFGFSSAKIDEPLGEIRLNTRKLKILKNHASLGIHDEPDGQWEWWGWWEWLREEIKVPPHSRRETNSTSCTAWIRFSQEYFVIS